MAAKFFREITKFVTTEIIYIINPEYVRFLRISLDTLLHSKSRFDTIKIFCVSEKDPGWAISDPRISLQVLPDLDREYFLFNKLRMTESSADRLIFLDADTLVLRPIEKVFKYSRADFLGRFTPPYTRPTWNNQGWLAACAAVKAERPAPYFNCGFVVFQNGAQHKVGAVWPSIMASGRNKSLYDPSTLHVNPHYHDQRYLDQISLSLAVAAAGLSWREMKPRDHSYAWNNDPWKSATVYHTAGPRFLALAEEIYRARGLSDRFSTLVEKPHLFP